MKIIIIENIVTDHVNQLLGGVVKESIIKINYL